MSRNENPEQTENVTTFPGQYVPVPDEDVTQHEGSYDIVPRSTAVIADDQFLHIEDIQDLYDLFQEIGVKVDNAEDVLGDGFTVVTGPAKMALVGKPLLFAQWRFANSQKYGPMVMIQAYEITGSGAKDYRCWRIIDSSHRSGICRDMLNYTEMTDKFNGLYLRKGLAVSNYTYEDPTTKESKPAMTFYLDYSK